MAIARMTEISATSQTSFDDALQQGVERANRTLRNLEGAWVKDQEVTLRDGQITEYKVKLKVTFVLDE
jgi:dodecin